MPTIQETIQKVSEFAELADGWHFGEGVAPSSERIGQAVGFLEYADFSGLQRANAFPGVGGQVEITFYNSDRVLEITIEKDHSITVAEDRDRKQIRFEEGLSPYDAYQRLEEFGQLVWSSSDQYTISIMIPNVRISQVEHSTSLAANPFQSLVGNVLKSGAGRYAPISQFTTINRLAFPPSTGQYLLVSFQGGVFSSWSQAPLETSATTTSLGGGKNKPEVFLSH